jgi:hypothetical protein
MYWIGNTYNGLTVLEASFDNFEAANAEMNRRRKFHYTIKWFVIETDNPDQWERDANPDSPELFR